MVGPSSKRSDRTRAVSFVIALVIAVGGLGVAVSSSAQAPAARHRAALVAFRGRGFHLGGGLFGRSRGYSYYGGYGSRHSILHHVGRTLFFVSLLHLFFSSGAASLLIWIVIIAVIAHLFRRSRSGRRGRYTY
jgi:hypothetical protein